MRVINAKTLGLEEFVGNIPPFYILSHRWGNDEITFKDLAKGRRKESLGYQKVVECCQFVLSQHDDRPPPLRTRDTTHSSARSPSFYVWIDTCCIDKRSSAELSEAINSMYAYYRDAGICLAYLSDVSSDGSTSKSQLEEQLTASSWFKRGWTLQELLAPKRVIFLNRDWQVIGSKGSTTRNKHRTQFDSNIYDRAPSLEKPISRITGIDEVYLSGYQQFSHASIAQRMSWAARRTTLRIEDTAYCLLGLFDVNMPLLYGEGPKAFVRLQEELLKQSNDQSLFAWWPPEPALRPYRSRYRYFKTGMLAPSPAYFQNSADIVTFAYARTDPHTQPYAITNAGLELFGKVRKVKLRGIERDLVYSIKLNCGRADAAVRVGPAIELAVWHVQPDRSTIGGYVRLLGVQDDLMGQELVEVESEEERMIYITPVEGLMPILTRR